MRMLGCVIGCLIKDLASVLTEGEDTLWCIVQIVYDV
jgi:hypothetical protein